MKKILFFIFTLFLCGCTNSINTNDLSSNEEESTSNTQHDLGSLQKKEYKENTENLMIISAPDLTEKMENEDDILIYFGRATCPYCRDFVADLNKVNNKNQPLIYYLDTEETDTNVNIREIRSTLNIEFVPSLIRVSNNGKTIESYDMSSDELMSFIEK